MKRNDLAKLIIEYGYKIGEKGYTPGCSGNISVRCGDNILITTSGSANGYLSLEDIVLIDFEGKSLELDKKASSEKMLHVEIYQKRPDINAIIHVHPPFLSGFAVADVGLEEPLMAENVYYFGKILKAEYGLPSSMDLVDKTVKWFDEYQVVLMSNHGVVIGDDNMKNAFFKLDLAENYAKTVFIAKTLGNTKMLTEEQVQAINALK